MGDGRMEEENEKSRPIGSDDDQEERKEGGKEGKKERRRKERKERKEEKVENGEGQEEIKKQRMSGQTWAGKSQLEGDEY